MIHITNIRRFTLVTGFFVGIIFFAAVPSVQAAVENNA